MSDRPCGGSKWPALPYADWAETCAALHLWSQVFGKYRLAHTPRVSSTGFWLGGGGASEPMFYSYGYPVPDCFADRSVEPAAARFDRKPGEFVLPYDAVRTSDEPESELMRFLKSTYAAAADLAQWDRHALECAFGIPRVPREVRV